MNTLNVYISKWDKTRNTYVTDLTTSSVDTESICEIVAPLEDSNLYIITLKNTECIVCNGFELDKYYKEYYAKIKS